MAGNKSLRKAHLVDAATITGVTGTTTGNSYSGRKTFQAVVNGTGAVTATVKIEVSNNPTLCGWVVLATFTLSGTTTATDGFASEASWLFYRGNVTALTGTGATVDVVVAEE